MHLKILLASALLMTAFSTSAEPMAPNEIQPILLGSEIPEATILDLDGKETRLADAVAGGPTLLIFYRGGW